MGGRDRDCVAVSQLRPDSPQAEWRHARETAAVPGLSYAEKVRVVKQVEAEEWELEWKSRVE